MGRLYFDDEGRVINSEPLPEVPKETPGYTKLPVWDDFAVSTLVDTIACVGYHGLCSTYTDTERP